MGSSIEQLTTSDNTSPLAVRTNLASVQELKTYTTELHSGQVKDSANNPMRLAVNGKPRQRGVRLHRALRLCHTIRATEVLPYERIEESYLCDMTCTVYNFCKGDVVIVLPKPPPPFLAPHNPPPPFMTPQQPPPPPEFPAYHTSEYAHLESSACPPPTEEETHTCGGGLVAITGRGGHSTPVKRHAEPPFGSNLNLAPAELVLVFPDGTVSTGTLVATFAVVYVFYGRYNMTQTFCEILRMIPIRTQPGNQRKMNNEEIKRDLEKPTGSFLQRIPSRKPVWPQTQTFIHHVTGDLAVYGYDESGVLLLQRKRQQQRRSARVRIDRSMIGEPTNFQHTGHIGSGDVDLGNSHLRAIQNQMQSKGGYETAFAVKVISLSFVVLIDYLYF
uniref:(California timema) hypothetical protein n=1 Tax=Timema californicum TaxID=61474 RepID=A0A7R9JAQ5_TIMCA|nr:unnamed protein product [Timema californicum]